MASRKRARAQNASGLMTTSVIIIIGMLFMSVLPLFTAADGKVKDHLFASWVKTSNGLPTSGEYWGVIFVDVNKDGNLDIVGADTTADTIRIFAGDGTGNWSEVPQTQKLGGGSDISAGDFDKDGNIDLVAGATGYDCDGIHIYKGDGTGKFTEITSGSGLPTASCWRSFAVGDVNKDGNLDIAATNGWGSSDGVHVFTSDSNGKFNDDSKGLPDNLGEPSGTVFADFDKDGNLDVTTGCEIAGSYLDNGGQGGSMTWTLSSSDLIDHTTCYTGFDATDFDKDGDMDLVISSQTGNVGARAFKNTNNGASWTNASIGLPVSGSYMDLVSADFDKDGNPDVGTVGYLVTAGIHVYYGDGIGSWTEDSSGLPTGNSYLGVDDGDFDGDGWADLVAGRQDGGIDCYRNIQNSGPAPPRVTSTNPMNGAIGVLKNATIVVTFSQAMDHAATEGAISANPSITGTFSWGGTSKTVTWAPSANLQVNTKYFVNVSKAARSQAGINLPSQYTFSFTTESWAPSPPTVSSTNPVDKATGIPVTTTIAITFSKAMNKSATEPAVSASPSITWTPAWTSGDTIVTFTPSASLKTGTKYTITISTAAKSADGAKMASPYEFSFTTVSAPTPPTVTATSPNNGSTNVPINTNMVVTFSVAMDKSATEAAISSGPSFTGTFGWDGASKVVTWTPGANLQTSTKYTITITTAAKSADGADLASQYQFSFTTKSGGGGDTTPPTVVNTDPKKNTKDVDRTTKVTITFSEAMDQAATEGSVTISPGAITGRTWNGNATLILTVDLTDGQTYTVTIGTGAKDIAGNSVRDKYVFSFTTKKAITPSPSNTIFGLDVMTFGLLIIIIVVVVVIAIVVMFLAGRRKRRQQPYDWQYQQSW